MVILLHARFGEEEAMGLAEVGIVDLVDRSLEEGGIDFAGFPQGKFRSEDLQNGWLVVQLVSDSLDSDGDDLVMVKGQSVGILGDFKGLVARDQLIFMAKILKGKPSNRGCTIARAKRRHGRQVGHVGQSQSPLTGSPVGSGKSGQLLGRRFRQIQADLFLDQAHGGLVSTFILTQQGFWQRPAVSKRLVLALDQKQLNPVGLLVEAPDQVGDGDQGALDDLL